MTLGADDPALFYEVHQAWPAETASAVARYLHSTLTGRPPRRCLFLGAATGVNDVLPFARLADRTDRLLASDVVPAYLERLRSRAATEALRNVDVRRVDIREDLGALGTFELVTLFFVIHRLERWEEVVEALADRVGEGGSLFLSEFVGPSGVIRLSNEKGGDGADPVSRLIRRHFELQPEPFDPLLKSTSIGPVRERLSRRLRASEVRDFVWRQRLTPADMHAKIAGKAYAPFFGAAPAPESLRILECEFAAEWHTPVEMDETIRLYRFTRPRS